MIIQFPNGAGIESSTIASIHASRAERVSNDITRPPYIVVYTFREGWGDFLSRNKPTASHFMNIQMPDDLTAENECRRLVAKWAGLPEPAPMEPLTAKSEGGI